MTMAAKRRSQPHVPNEEQQSNKPIVIVVGDRLMSNNARVSYLAESGEENNAGETGSSRTKPKETPNNSSCPAHS
jgi:hypothetical protein